MKVIITRKEVLRLVGIVNRERRTKNMPEGMRWKEKESYFAEAEQSTNANV